MKAELEAAARECGLTLTDDMLNSLDSYWAYLKEVNAQMNLTTVVADDEAVWRHFMDSLAPEMAGLIPRGARLIDIGSGAGFPGLPLAIARPDVSVTLLDSLQKRVNFLTDAAQRAGARVGAVHMRAEEAAAGELREQFDVATARAVARLNVLCEIALPFVRVGGALIAYKGPAAPEELREATNAIRRLGGGDARIIDARIPGRESLLVVVRKLAPTPGSFPRRPGEAARKPL